MVFSAVSMDSSFEVVDLVPVGEKNKTNNNNNCMLCYAILIQFNLKWKQSRKIVQHSCFIQTESYLVVSTHSLGPVHLRWGGGGTSSMPHVWLLVWLSVHGFACWSTPEAILFSWSIHLLLDPKYRYLQQVTQRAQFMPVLGTSDFIFHQYQGNIYWHMPV